MRRLTVCLAATVLLTLLATPAPACGLGRAVGRVLHPFRARACQAQAAPVAVYSAPVPVLVRVQVGPVVTPQCSPQGCQAPGR